MQSFPLHPRSTAKTVVLAFARVALCGLPAMTLRALVAPVSAGKPAQRSSLAATEPPRAA